MPGRSSYHPSTWQILKLLCMQWKLRYKWKFTILSSYKLIIHTSGLSRWLSGWRICLNVGDAGSMPRPGRSPGGGHSNPLQYSAWRIPWTEDPGGIQSMESQSIGHDKINWARMHTHPYYNVCWSKSYRGTSLVVWAFLIAQLVKNLPAVREILVWFLGGENPLEKG